MRASVETYDGLSFCVAVQIGRITGPARPSVCPSVIRASNSKSKRRRKIELDVGLNVLHDKSN